MLNAYRRRGCTGDDKSGIVSVKILWRSGGTAQLVGNAPNHWVLGGIVKRSDPPELAEGLAMVCPFAIAKAFGPFDFAQGRLLTLPPPAQCPEVCTDTRHLRQANKLANKSGFRVIG